jgi:hypothetical protein
MLRNLILSTNSFVGKKVSIGLRYVIEMGAAEGVVIEESSIGVLVQVKRNTVFYPWTSIVYLRIDE